VRSGQLLDGLEFDDDRAIYQQIRPERTYSPIPEARFKPELPLDFQASVAEGDRHGLLVHWLEKPVSKLAIDLEENTDDFLGNTLVLESVLISVHLRPVFTACSLDALTGPICIR
jgi:hypothetical protein